MRAPCALLSENSARHMVRFREADAAQKVSKADVRTKRIEAWPKQHSRIESLLVALFEPIHGSILVAKSCVDHGNFRGV